MDADTFIHATGVGNLIKNGEARFYRLDNPTTIVEKSTGGTIEITQCILFYGPDLPVGGGVVSVDGRWWRGLGEFEVPPVALKFLPVDIDLTEVVAHHPS